MKDESTKYQWAVDLKQLLQTLKAEAKTDLGKLNDTAPPKKTPAESESESHAKHKRPRGGRASGRWDFSKFSGSNDDADDDGFGGPEKKKRKPKEDRFKSVVLCRGWDILGRKSSSVSATHHHSIQ